MRARIPLLRYDHPGVFGSGGSTALSDPPPPTRQVQPGDAGQPSGQAAQQMAMSPTDVAHCAALLMGRGCPRIVLAGASAGSAQVIDALNHQLFSNDLGGVQVVGLVSVGAAPQVVRFFKTIFEDCAPPRGQSADEFVQERTKRLLDAPKGLPRGLPKLFVQGTKDTLSQEADMLKYLEGVPPPAPTMHYVEGANHMLEGRESDVATMVVDFVQSL
jgi:pimeloyl-ACP methyl ester carboxylesterase